MPRRPLWISEDVWNVPGPMQNSMNVDSVADRFVEDEMAAELFYREHSDIPQTDAVELLESAHVRKSGEQAEGLFDGRVE